MRSATCALVLCLLPCVPALDQAIAQVVGPNGPSGPAIEATAASARIQFQAELETRINNLKAEHKAFMAQLYAILEMAEQERATRTAETLRAFIRDRQRQYNTELTVLESRLNRFKRVLSQEDKKELLTRRAGTSAPLFQLIDQDGKAVRLSEYRGKLVVLEWVDPNCPFWRYLAQRGTLKHMAAKYKESGVVWLAVNSCDWASRAQNNRVATRFEIPYPILDDHTGRTAREYMATNTPYVVLVDRDGKIAYNGAVDNTPLGRPQGPPVNYLEKAITELLKGSPVSTTYAKPYGTPIKTAASR